LSVDTIICDNLILAKYFLCKNESCTIDICFLLLFLYFETNVWMRNLNFLNFLHYVHNFMEQRPSCEVNSHLASQGNFWFLWRLGDLRFIIVFTRTLIIFRG
jgi:hypothetical protein